VHRATSADGPGIQVFEVLPSPELQQQMAALHTSPPWAAAGDPPPLGLAGRRAEQWHLGKLGGEVVAIAKTMEFTVTNADGSDGHNAKYGCWIGFQDLGSEGGFAWYDGASVDYADWAVGEPNDVNGGEDAVEMDFRQRLTRFGEWNDATMDQGYEEFPLCETSIPAPVPGEPMNWGTDVQASFRVSATTNHCVPPQSCVDFHLTFI
jgi:hypothetical protein